MGGLNQCPFNFTIDCRLNQIQWRKEQMKLSWPRQQYLCAKRGSYSSYDFHSSVLLRPFPKADVGFSKVQQSSWSLGEAEDPPNSRSLLSIYTRWETPDSQRSHASASREPFLPWLAYFGSHIDWEAVSQAWLNPPCHGQGEPEGQEEDCMW